jgi:hypothetical protein
MDDFRVLETAGCTSSIRHGSHIELIPGTRILLGHEEKCRLAFIQMLSAH